MQQKLLHDIHKKGMPNLKRNSRLSLALHTLSHMAANPERISTSAEIAEHAGTNPVVVRRVLGTLRKFNLVKSEKGHAGGWYLGRSPEKITVADVYLALNEKLIKESEKIQDSQCSHEHNLHEKISTILEQLEEDLVQRLGNINMIEICEEKVSVQFTHTVPSKS